MKSATIIVVLIPYCYHHHHNRNNNHNHDHSQNQNPANNDKVLLDHMQVGIPVLGVVENMSGLSQQLHKFKFFTTSPDGAQQDVTQQLLQHLPAELQVTLCTSDFLFCVHSVSLFCCYYYLLSSSLLLISYNYSVSSYYASVLQIATQDFHQSCLAPLPHRRLHTYTPLTAQHENQCK